MSRLRRDVSDRIGRRVEVEGDHVRALRRDALDRVQTRTALRGEQGLPDHLCGRRYRRCTAHHQRDQRSESARRTDDRYRRRRFPPARQCGRCNCFAQIRPADQRVAGSVATAVALVSHERAARVRSRFPEEFIEDADSGLKVSCVNRKTFL